MISHRGRAFEEMFIRVQDGLRHVFGTTRPVYVATSSATGFMEAGIRALPSGPVLALVNGAFSDRFAHIARACGRPVERYDVAWGDVHDPQVVAARLAEAQYSAVLVVHSETSTGALNDVRAITEIAHAAGVRCLVDSVTGVGGAELHTDAWKLDYVLTGSQKALALPPGLAFAVASEAMIADAASVPDRGVYFDLVEFDTFAAKQQAPNTPALSLYFALERQLTDIMTHGIEARWARHLAMAERTWQWDDHLQRHTGLGVRVLAPNGHRSPTVTTVVLPDDVRSGPIIKAIAERGFTIGTGYGKLKESTIRIGHMGDHTIDGLERCLDVCAGVLRAHASA